MADVKQLKAEVAKGFRLNEVTTIVAIVVASIGTSFGAYRVVLGEARAQTDAGIEPLTHRVATLEQNQSAVMTELRELRIDQREAYKAQRDDRRSPRLESPLPPMVLDAGK